MKKLLFCVFGLVLIWVSGKSQQLSPTLMSCSGGSSSSDLLRLDWSLGEANVASLFHSNLLITQGFNQPYLSMNPVKENGAGKNQQIFAFPNPASNHIILYLNEKPKQRINLILTDNIGHTISTPQFQLNENQIDLNIEALPAGTYFLQFIDDKETPTTIRFIKIN